VQSRDCLVYLELKIKLRIEEIGFSRSLINLETLNLEIIQQLRDKSRKPVSRCKNLGLKISAQTIVSFDSDQIRRLEITDLEILKSRLELQKSRD
jgi:hypothetical protein